MACVTITAIAAVATYSAQRILNSKEIKNPEKKERFINSRKLSWLTKLLGGGSALLIFEHIWHGEIVPWPPFFTAASNPEDLSNMFREMSTVGVGMLLSIIFVWCVMLLVSRRFEKGSKSLETEMR